MATVEDSIRLRDGFSPVIQTIRTTVQGTTEVINHFRVVVEQPINSAGMNALTGRVNVLETELRQAREEAIRLQEGIRRIGEVGRAGIDALNGRTNTLENELRQAREESRRLLDELRRVSETGRAGMEALTGRMNTLEGELRQAREETRRLQEELRRMGEEGRRGAGSAGKGAGMAMMNFAALLQIVAQASVMLKKFTDTADNMVSIKARIELINDGSQSDQELDAKIVASAKRAGAAYQSTAAAISKMGILAGEAFSSNDEMVYFSELMNKTFAVGGSGIQEQTAAMYQLTQAMAAGKLQGDEFRSIMENAPMLAQAIADVTGKTKGELKQMSADGVITSEVIKSAMFTAANDIEAKFAKMPLTFGQMMNNMKTDALVSLEPVIARFSEWLNSSQGSLFFETLSNTIVSVASGGMWMVDILSTGANFIAENWEVVEPILWGVAAAIGALTIAQWGMNAALAVAALLSMPMQLTVLAIAAGIGAIVAIGTAIYRNDEAFNWFSLRINWILDDWETLKLGLTKAGYFIANVFDVMKAAVLQSFQDMFNGIVTVINGLFAAANEALGTDLKQIEQSTAGTKAFEKAEVNKSRREEAIKDMDFQNALASSNRNYELNVAMNRRRAEKENKTEKDAYNLKDLFNPEDYKIDKIPDITKVGKVGSVGSIEDKVDISAEDLKVMRELAEVQAIQKFISYSPEIRIETGDIVEKANLDEMMELITVKLDLEREACINA